MTEAYFTLSKSKVLDQYQRLKEISDVISYSSKTNPIVTPILESNTNSFFSLHLKEELKNVKDKGRVYFLAQGLEDELLSFLIKEGIDKFVVDNIEDLNFLINYINKNDVYIDLLLRMKLKENTLRTEKHFVFGIASKIVNEKIRELNDNVNIKKLGIHMHRKTQNMAEWNYEYELSRIIDSDVWEKIDLLNIGGGLPSIYANTNKKVIDSIIKKLKSFKSWVNKKNVKLIIEPGRYIAAPAGKLHTTILLNYDNNLIVNASVYNTDLDALIVPVKLLVEGEFSMNDAKSRDDVLAYVIKGKTPCSMDLFRYRVYLTEKKQGDEIVFLNAGAYNFSTEFCDLEKLETKIVA